MNMGVYQCPFNETNEMKEITQTNVKIQDQTPKLVITKDRISYNNKQTLLKEEQICGS